VSFNVANTPEQIFWNQKKVREAVAKAAGILPNSISYYQVTPNTDDYGRPFTSVRFVISNRNPELASNLMSALNNEEQQNKLKNRIEELNLDLIGDSMKAQTPTDFKAAARGSALPSATMMDATGGMNGALPPPLAGGRAGAAGAAGAGMLPVAGGNATAGLPGGAATPGAARASSALTRRERQNAAQKSGAAARTAAGGLLLPALLAAGALLL
jgi:hypothetical protein